MYFFADIMYVHGKVHALFNNLFRKKDYIELINTRNFNTLFPGNKIEFQKEKFSELKELLFREQIKKVILLTEASRDYHYLFLAFLRIYELKNIKQILARSFGRKGIIEQWNDIYPFQTFSRDLLRKDLTPDFFIEIVSDTYLGNIMEKDEELRYEIVESRLDLHLINSFFGFARYFSGSNRSIFKAYMERKLFITKTIWHDRLIKFYKWPLNRTAEFIDHVFSSISGGRESSNGKEMIFKEIDLEIQKIRERKSVEDIELPEIEQSLDKYFWRYVNMRFNTDFHRIYSVISYIWLLYYQIDNINRIIEGLRFGIDTELLINTIICEE